MLCVFVVKGCCLNDIRACAGFLCVRGIGFAIPLDKRQLVCYVGSGRRSTF